MKQKRTEEERKEMRKARNARYQARLKTEVTNTSLEGFKLRTKAIEIGEEE